MSADLSAAGSTAIVAEQLGELAIVVAGLLLMIGFRRLAGKMFIVGIFLAIAAGIAPRFIH